LDSARLNEEENWENRAEIGNQKTGKEEKKVVNHTKWI
jgi:hypothetical protein